LRSAGALSRTVSIKVRFHDFTTLTRSRTLRSPTDVGQEIFEVAGQLYDALGLDRARIRLVGVRAEGLVPAAEAPVQLLLGARDRGWRHADQAADRASRRFGAGTVRPATLIDPLSPSTRSARAAGPPEGMRPADDSQL
jgi:DNA polymerase-4